MTAVLQLLTFLTQITTVLIALVTGIDYLRSRNQARLDVSLMFGALAMIVLTQWLALSGSQNPWVGKLGSLLLMAHPYLLLRLTHHLRPVPRRIRLFAWGGLLLSELSLIFLPAPLPGPVSLLLVLYFVVVEGYASLALVRGAMATSGVSHWRLLLAAAGSGLIALLILLAGLSVIFPTAAPLISSISQLVGLLAIVAYYLGFATPAFLRRNWQLAELNRYLMQSLGQRVSEPVEATLQRLCEAALRATGGAYALAALWDEPAGRLLPRASSRLTEEYRRPPLEEATIQEVWRRRKAAIVQVAPAAASGEAGEREGVSAYFVLPIQLQDRAWGLLLVALLRAPLFASDDLALLSLFCEQAAISMGYDVLIDELRRSNQRLEALNEIDRDILAARSSAKIAQAALSHLRKLANAERASVVLFDPERDAGEFIAVDAGPGLGPAAGTTLPLSEFPSQEMLAAGSHNFPDIRDMPERVPLVERMLASGLCSLILVPLRFDGKLIGEVTVSSTRAAAFQSVHQQIAREVADQLAISLQQARLREQLECYAVELEQRVAERTTQLEAAVAELQKEVDARTQAEEAVQKLNRDLKQHARELKETNTELEAFAYSVSHDLRAPLRAIDGFSRIVLAEHAGDLPEEAQRYLQLVRDNTRQMGQLIDDLLSFSRLNRQPLNKISVEPNAIVRLVLKDMAQVQNLERVNIAVDNLPPCQADPGLLRQVYANLLSNAFKFTGKREAACIEVGCREQDDERVYYVKDNGVGFDMQFAAKIFGVFQRLHRAEDYEGTGVGLAIVQRIINRHGGRIWAEAEPEKGATFNFTLGEP